MSLLPKQYLYQTTQLILEEMSEEIALDERLLLNLFVPVHFFHKRIRRKSWNEECWLINRLVLLGMCL